MPTDKENVSFLYSIIRQLETKYVSWKIVAHDNDITNDHAARMRFHRLRQQFEGLTPKKRGPRRGADDKGGKGKCRPEFGDNASDEEGDQIKRETKRKMCKTEESESEEDALARHRAKKRTVKQEPGEGGQRASPAAVKREPGDAPVSGPHGKSPAGVSANVVAGRLGQRENSTVVMRPGNPALGMAPPPALIQGGHLRYHPMMPPAPYRGLVPLLGPPTPGRPMPGQPMLGQPMPRPSMSGPPMRSLPKPGLPMPGSPMSGAQLSGPKMSGLPQYGPPNSGSPMPGQQMSSRPFPRLSIVMPLRPKNAPFERLPPSRVVDLPQSAENAEPVTHRANSISPLPPSHGSGNPNAVQAKLA